MLSNNKGVVLLITESGSSALLCSSVTVQQAIDNPAPLCTISGFETFTCIQTCRYNFHFLLSLMQVQSLIMSLLEYTFSGFSMFVSSFIKSCFLSTRELTSPDIDIFI